VEWTRFENVPAYVAAQDVPVSLPGFAEVKADIAYGGNYFAIVEWRDPALRIGPENGRHFRELGRMVKEQIDTKLHVRHPTVPHIGNVDIVTFWHEPTRPEALYRNVHVLSSGLLDRSPGGTGTSAMMAMLEARGRIKIGQTIQSEGLLGSGTFEGRLVRETRLGSHRAVVPTVKGTANIIGYAKWLLDPDDPVGRGFVVT
jgi:proline racemase